MQNKEFIPRVIHQIWCGDQPKPVKLMQTWKDKHPDFKFMLWNNETVLGRSWKCAKQIEQMWNAGRFNGVADILRYEILFEFGGFVAPADSKCLNPIDDLLDCECFCCYESEKVMPDLLSPHIGTERNSLLMDYLISAIKNTEDVLYAFPWEVTGNALLTGAVQKLEYPIVILPSYTFVPEHYSGEKYTGEGKIYAKHIWGTTKNITGNLDDYAD